MDDLIRRALLGDKEAQEEVTQQGIVLPCPLCGKSGASTRYVLGDYWCECPHCNASSGFRSSEKMAIADWNTRPAPPIVQKLRAKIFMPKTNIAALREELEHVKAERDAAVKFIKYLDCNYSNYMSEDEKFSEWKGV